MSAPASFNSLFALRWSSTNVDRLTSELATAFQFALCAEVVFD